MRRLPNPALQVWLAEGFWMGLLLLVSVVTAITAVWHWQGIATLFWDAKVYERAVADVGNGLNPYRTDHPFIFVYHPYVLQVLVWLDHFGGVLNWLLLLYGGATLFFFVQGFLSLRAVLDTETPGLLLMAFALCGLAYGGAGALAVVTGNMTLFVHLFLMGVFLGWVRTGQRVWLVVFLLSVTLFAIVKPYFLAFLLLLAIMPIRQAIFLATLSILFFALIFCSAEVAMPQWYDHYFAALNQQILAKSDLGYSFFGLASRHLSTGGAMLVHALISAALVVGVFWWAVYRRGSVWKIVPLLVVVAVLVNPRLKEYDVPPMMMALFVWLHLTVGRSAVKPILMATVAASLPLYIEALYAQGWPVWTSILYMGHQFQMGGVGCLVLYGMAYRILQKVE